MTNATVCRDTTRSEHEVTEATSINDVACDLTIWLAARDFPGRPSRQVTQFSNTAMQRASSVTGRHGDNDDQPRHHTECPCRDGAVPEVRAGRRSSVGLLRVKGKPAPQPYDHVRAWSQSACWPAGSRSSSGNSSRSYWSDSVAGSTIGAMPIRRSSRGSAGGQAEGLSRVGLDRRQVRDLLAVALTAAGEDSGDPSGLGVGGGPGGPGLQSQHLHPHPALGERAEEFVFHARLGSLYGKPVEALGVGDNRESVARSGILQAVSEHVLPDGGQPPLPLAVRSDVEGPAEVAAGLGQLADGLAALFDAHEAVAGRATELQRQAEGER
ncbi:hypothetical protein CG747_36990 [Streptomyces sp. CB02959]|nr:hypothetical protein CG747_36990 [Streptomyces sp. CB02959]